MSDIGEGDPHPKIDELKDYVAIGPTKDLSFSVHKRTFDKGFIFFTIIFIGALAAASIVTMYYAYNQSVVQPVTNVGRTTSTTSPLVKNLGAVSSISEFVESENGSGLNTKSLCLQVENTRWNEDHCECNENFYGKFCSQEKHDKKYFAVGTPNESNISFNKIKTIKSENKSFNKNSNIGSCSYYCDNEPDCNGFIYHKPGRCTLLKNEIYVPKNNTIPYSPEIESTLYMKNTKDINFEGRIFISETEQGIPPRYWLMDVKPRFAYIIPDTLNTIYFVPNHIKIVGQYIGIYSLNPFTQSDIEQLLQIEDNDTIYIHDLNTDLSPPIDWKFKTPIYVMYV
jgi:hypothetical protein